MLHNKFITPAEKITMGSGSGSGSERRLVLEFLWLVKSFCLGGLDNSTWGIYPPAGMAKPLPAQRGESADRGFYYLSVWELIPERGELAFAQPLG